MNWSIINLILFFAVLAYTLYLFTHILYSRYLFVKLGKKVNFQKALKERINEIMVQMFGHKTLLRDKKSGIMHFIMFYGFIILQFGAIDLIGKGLTGNAYWLQDLLFGGSYSFFVLMQEITVVMIILAVGYAGYRRFIEKLPRLKRNFKSSLVIIFLSSLMLTVLFSLGMEAVILGHTGDLSGYNIYHPFSSIIGMAFAWLPLGVAEGAFLFFWWAHNIVLFSFLLYVPQSKHFHLIVAPLNVFIKRRDRGVLRSIDFEDESAEEFGVNKIEDFYQDQLVDLYACVECGRCTSVCPAAGTGKMLNPMELIVKLRNHLTEKGAAVTSRAPWMPAYAFSGSALADNQLAQSTAQFQTNSTSEGEEAVTTSDVLQKVEYNEDLIGNVITEAEIWACTTCGNCEDICPVENEHVDKIMDMRRHLVLTQGKVEPEAQRAFQNIERQSNPWGINRKERANWRDEREDTYIPTVQEVEEFDILWFVGSMGSFDNRNQKVAHSFAKIMNAAGVKFAILGNEEKSSGDTVRRMGNEFLFQELCQENIATLQKYNVKKIVTACPHTFHTLKNEYPEFGLEAEVMHHTELLYQLLEEGKIKPTKEVQEAITYHDSCYLGRYNNIYDLPRKILQTIPGVEIREMERNKQDGMCCGAGGGMMWMEETEGTRVNLARTEQALEVKPSMISSGCPYCLTMMSDGTKMLEVEDEVATKDIVEILELSLDLPNEQIVH